MRAKLRHASGANRFRNLQICVAVWSEAIMPEIRSEAGCTPSSAAFRLISESSCGLERSDKLIVPEIRSEAGLRAELPCFRCK